MSARLLLAPVDDSPVGDAAVIASLAAGLRAPLLLLRVEANR